MHTGFYNDLPFSLYVDGLQKGMNLTLRPPPRRHIDRCVHKNLVTGMSSMVEKEENYLGEKT